MNVRDASELARQVGAIVGDAHVRAPRRHESRAASIVVEPRDADEVAELVRKCEADSIALAPMGAARTLAQIRPTPVAVGISLTRMNRVIAYEPDDMTVIAEAGLTLGALNDLARCARATSSGRSSASAIESRSARWSPPRTPDRCGCPRAPSATC